MLLPDININVNPKYIVYCIIGFCAIGTFVLIGYLLALQPKEVVCRNYIEELDVANAQVINLEKDLNTRVTEASLDCVKREKTLCSELVDSTVENIKKLRCRICKAQGVK